MQRSQRPVLRRQKDVHAAKEVSIGLVEQESPPPARNHMAKSPHHPFLKSAAEWQGIAASVASCVSPRYWARIPELTCQISLRERKVQGERGADLVVSTLHALHPLHIKKK